MMPAGGDRPNDAILEVLVGGLREAGQIILAYARDRAAVATDTKADGGTVT